MTDVSDCTRRTNRSATPTTDRGVISGPPNEEFDAVNDGVIANVTMNSGGSTRGEKFGEAIPTSQVVREFFIFTCKSLRPITSWLVFLYNTESVF